MKRLHIPSIINILTLNELLWMHEPIFSSPETGIAWNTSITKLKPCEKKRAEAAAARLGGLIFHFTADYYQNKMLNANNQISTAEKDVLRAYHEERVTREIFEKLMPNRLMQIIKKTELTKEQKDAFNSIKEGPWFTSHEIETQNIRDEDFILRLKDHQVD
jgi:hypothetical protein